LFDFLFEVFFNYILDLRSGVQFWDKIHSGIFVRVF